MAFTGSNPALSAATATVIDPPGVIGFPDDVVLVVATTFNRAGWVFGVGLLNVVAVDAFFAVVAEVDFFAAAVVAVCPDAPVTPATDVEVVD